MDVDVGLHQASPPLSNCGYSPAWISCEYCGTASFLPAPTPTGLGIAGFALRGSEANAPTIRTAGETPPPPKSVTMSRYAVSGLSLAKNVSIAMKPSASPCPPTEVRRMVSSP
jgi:hypothetical protein